jgi:hypothetical protein
MCVSRNWQLACQVRTHVHSAVDWVTFRHWYIHSICAFFPPPKRSKRIPQERTIDKVCIELKVLVQSCGILISLLNHCPLHQVSCGLLWHFVVEICLASAFICTIWRRLQQAIWIPTPRRQRERERYGRPPHSWARCCTIPPFHTSSPFEFSFFPSQQ